MAIGVRQKLNDNKMLGVAMGAGIVLVGVVLVAAQFVGGGGGEGLEAPDQVFYTDDDGKTFFKDDANKVVPFDHKGKQAYRADVFKCPDGKEFVGVMYRHTAGGKQEMQNYLANVRKQDASGQFRQALEYRGMEVKRVGADAKANWAPNDEATAEHLRATTKCGSGGAAATWVAP